MPRVDNPSFEDDADLSETGAGQFSSPSDSSPFAGACEKNGRSLEDAWSHLRAGADADAQLSEESFVERARQQAILIKLEQTGWRVPDADVQQLGVLSNKTSEHDVRYASPKCVLKITWPGWYGQVPIIFDGKLRRVEATPSQYLERIRRFNAVFHGEIKLIGFCVSDRPSLIIGEPAGQPSIVVSQPFYEAANPNDSTPPALVDRFMRELGFVPVRDSYFGWVRSEDGVVVVDAKPDNFVLAAAGIVPIDLQIAQYDPLLVRQIVIE